MKSIVISALLGLVAAQGSLPACGQLCVNNMLGLAPSLGCQATDAKCLCQNASFANGLKDCSGEACGADIQSSVVAYGVAYCSSAGVTLGGNSPATGSASATGSGSASTSTDAAASASSSASSALSSASNSASSALSSVSSSISGALASASSSAASAASSAKASGSGSASSSSGFAMKTSAPLAGAGALGLAALLLV